MIDLGLERDDWSFEWKVVEFELDFKLSSLEGSGLWACDEDIPDGAILRSNNLIASSINEFFTLSLTTDVIC